MKKSTILPRKAILLIFFTFISLGLTAQSQEYYELRTYSLTSSEQRANLEKYWEEAGIPALNRMRIETVGVFKEMEPQEEQKLYVLIPYRTLAELEKVHEELLTDPDHLQTGKIHLDAPFEKPAFERVESSLMKAFSHLPQLEVPEQKDRIFELRIYESHSEKFAKKKVKMFNEGGEIEIFRKTGLQPVFFGETLIGSKMPNLTYLITAPDMESHKKHWEDFIADPEWKELSGQKEYENTVSNIINVFLVPTSFSQI
jgi:hypothetical protein